MEIQITSISKNDKLKKIITTDDLSFMIKIGEEIIFIQNKEGDYEITKWSGDPDDMEPETPLWINHRKKIVYE